LAYFIVSNPSDLLDNLPWLSGIDSNQLMIYLLVALAVLAIAVFMNRTRSR
jgi:hypothetical protein